ncbi:MAG: transposase [Bacteroidetes bacterium]|nr:transposase [Bacteroidota bacterium]
MSTKRTVRYSSAFKLKVIGQIERGELTMEAARRIYDIGGGSTVRGWLKAYGRSDLLPQQVRVQMKDENDKLKAQADRIRELEHALSESRLEVLALRSTLEVWEEDYGVDIKKKSVTKASLAALQKKLDTGSKPSAESTE